MKRILIFIFTIIGCLLLTDLALAVSVGVKPKELNLKATIGMSAETELLIVNTGIEPAFYQIYPDDFTKKITVQPSDFRLEPNGNQIVSIIVKSWKPEKSVTNLSVVARPLNIQGLSANPGVKVPLVINSVFSIWLKIIAISIISICLLTFFMIKFKKED